MKETSVRSESTLGVNMEYRSTFLQCHSYSFSCVRSETPQRRKKPKVIPRLINLNSVAPAALQYYKVSFDDIGVAQSNLAQFIQHRNWDEQWLMVRATALSSW